MQYHSFVEMVKGQKKEGKGNWIKLTAQNFELDNNLSTFDNVKNFVLKNK